MTLTNIYEQLQYYPNFPREGITFIDIMPLFIDAPNRDALANYINDLIPKDVDVIVAPEARGLMLACLTSYNNGRMLVPLRKKGKLPGKTYTYTFDTEYSTDTLECQQLDLTGKKCLFLDDVYATGGTYEAAKSLISQCNGTLVSGLVLLDLFNKAPQEITELFKEVKQQ